MNKETATGNLETLPTPSLRHSWNDIPAQHLSGLDQPDGNDRTVKTCSQCSIKKITVHPPQGFPWLEWQRSNGVRMWGQKTPPCKPGVKR